MAAPTNVKKLKSSAMVWLVGGYNSVLLHGNTLLQKTEETYTPPYGNPTKSSFDVYLVIGGDLNGTKVCRLNDDMESFLESV